MKAVVCYASDQDLAFIDRDSPQPRAGEVLVRIRRCGICGSELHMPDGPPRSFAGGLIMGHEYAGEIVEVGKGVTSHRVGEMVALYPALGCGECRACRYGNEILCGSARRLLGGYAEYVCIPAKSAIQLPSHLSAADGALVEPLAVSHYGVEAAQITSEDTVLVLGAGSIALGAVFWARRNGARKIVVMSRSDARAPIAMAMGADAFVPYGENEISGVRDVCGTPPDVVLECVGAPGFLSKAIAHAAVFGRIISLGFSNRADPILPAQAGMKDLLIRFPVGYTRSSFQHVAQTMLDGPIDPKIMISSTVPLEEAPQMFAHLLGRHAETKVQIAP